MGRKLINFLEDEEISNCVKKYPCLYDKGDQYYKDKRAKNNAWKKFEEKLGMAKGKILRYANIFILLLKLRQLT